MKRSLGSETGLRYEALPSRRGALSLRADGGGGALWVHSAVDPLEEARRRIADEDLSDRPLLVLVGGGLGWLAAAAEGAPCATLSLDPDARALAEAARAAGHEFPPGLERPVGGAEEQLATLTVRQRELGWPDLVVVASPAVTRLAPAWAERVLGQLPPGRHRAGLGAVVRRGPFEARRVLIVDSGYFLLRECVDGFARIGIETLRVPLSKAGGAISPTAPHRRLEPDGDFLERLLESVASGRPDFVFAVNHIGFDRGGRLLDLLDSLRLPLAVWYVDSPDFILDGALAAVRASTALFSWERAWIEPMRRLGFGTVEHLPLAAHEGFDRAHRPRVDTSFVGGSNVEAVAKWRGRLGLPGELEADVEDLLEGWRHRPGRELPRAALDGELAARPRLAAWLDADRRRRLESLLVLEGTQRDRLELLRAFGPERCVLHGDGGWRALLPGWNPGAPLDYYRELPAHFASCRIALNRTSRQMPTALNQRAFDAPLAGALPLGENQADLEACFEPGSECLAWREPAEAVQLAQELLADEPRRASIAARARCRVLAEHLYRHRLRRLVDTLIRVHGQ